MTHLLIVYFGDGTSNTMTASSLNDARRRANDMLEKPNVRRVIIAHVVHDIEKQP